MKSRKTVGTIFYCCALAFYILAAINIFNGESGIMGAGIMWLGLGAAFTGLGAAVSEQGKRGRKGKDSKKERYRGLNISPLFSL